MSKKIKIGLSILALISIALSLFVLFDSKLFSKKSFSPEEALIQEAMEDNLPPNEELPKDVDLQPELKDIPQEDKSSLIPPVEKKYFENIVMAEENVQVLSFFLDPEAPIKAIFKGKITKVLHEQTPFPNELPFEEILLEREDGEIGASYIYLGETLIKEGDMVEQGAVLAKAKEGGLDFRSGTNLSLWLHDKEGEFIRLSKEMFD